MSVALDIVLVVVLVAYLVHGWRVGFVRSIGSIAGLVAGGCAAALLSPLIGSLVPAGTGRVVASIVVALVLVVVGYAIGSRIGAGIGGVVRKTPLGPIDRVLGAAAQFAVTAVVLTILASAAVSLRTPYVAQPAAGSTVLRTIGSALPAPVLMTVQHIGSDTLPHDLGSVDGPRRG